MSLRPSVWIQRASYCRRFCKSHAAHPGRTHTIEGGDHPPVDANRCQVAPVGAVAHHHRVAGRDVRTQRGLAPVARVPDGEGAVDAGPREGGAVGGPGERVGDVIGLELDEDVASGQVDDVDSLEVAPDTPRYLDPPVLCAGATFVRVVAPIRGMTLGVGNVVDLDGRCVE